MNSRRATGGRDLLPCTAVVWVNKTRCGDIISCSNPPRGIGSLSFWWDPHMGVLQYERMMY